MVPPGKCGPSGPFTTAIDIRKEPPSTNGPSGPYAEWTKLQKSPFLPTTLGQQPSHAHPPPKTNMPIMKPPSHPSEPKLEATRRRRGGAATNKYVLSKRGEIGAEFDFLRRNLQCYAKLTLPTNAPKPEGNLGILPQSTDQGETSDTRLAWDPVPRPASERGVDKNPKLLCGAVVRSQTCLKLERQ